MIKSFFCVAGLLLSVHSSAQTFPAPTYFTRLFTKGSGVEKIRGVEGFGDFIAGNKLRLSLRDAVRLTVLNNTDARLDQLQIRTAKLEEERAYGPFDPVLTSSFSPSRSTSPTTSTLQAGQNAQIYSNLTQQFQSQYSQQLQSGTLFQVTMGIGRSATNSSFATFTPAIPSSLGFSITQPLLRNRGFLITRAPIIVAQYRVKQSQSAFYGQVNDLLLRAINSYWDVVQARENLDVLSKSLELAEASYKRDKRALELGALPQLDIYRSESQVAQRKLSVIQGETQLLESEEELRRMIGADLDPQVDILEIQLSESAAPSDMISIDLQDALHDALTFRPEMESLQQQLATDDVSIRLAENGLKPDLSVGSFYTTSGVGGNQIEGTTGTMLSRGGLGDAFDELGSFNFPSYGATLQLRLPLRNRTDEADLGTAIVSKQRNLYLVRQMQQAIGLEVRNAIHQLENAKQSVAAAQVSRDLSEKNLQAEQRKYELGSQTIFFVLDAQNQLSQAEQSLVQAQISYQRAVAGLDHARGKLLDQYGIQALNTTP